MVAPVALVIRRRVSDALALLVILAALVALVAGVALELRTRDLGRSAEVIDRALSGGEFSDR